MIAMSRLPSAAVLATIVTVFLILGLLVYGTSLENSFVSWDDPSLISENRNIQAITPTTIRNVFTSYDPELYIPLTFVSYQLSYRIGGLSPFVFHLTDLLLHVINALLVAWLLFIVLKRGGLALALGALFLLHPLNTEAVAWASARKDVLSTCFFLSSLLAALYARESQRKSMLSLSLGLFIGGVLSKVMVITLPVVMLMMDVLERRPIDRRALLEKLPFFTISVVFGIIALFGKAKILVTTSLLQKMLMACKATMFTIATFIVPSDLSVMYPYTNVIKFSSPDIAIPVLLTIALLMTAWFLRHRSRLITFGLLFYVLTLMPTFTNFAKGGDVYVASDRYAYIPMIGLLIVVGAMVIAWSERPAGVVARRSRQKTQMGFAAVVLVVSSYLSAAQATTWQSSISLYQNVLARHPNAMAARNNLGLEYLAMGRYDDAIREFDQAAAIRKNPLTQANRAAALVAKGSLDEALVEYQKALDVDPALPDALYGIGNIYQKRGELQKAAEQYRRTLAADPSYANALNNLGAVYIQLQEWDAAIETLQSAINKRPDFIASYLNLAGVYMQRGMKADAEAMYRHAVERGSTDADALAYLATFAYERGSIDEAAGLLRQALTIDSSNPTAIALVLQMKKDGVAE